MPTRRLRFIPLAALLGAVALAGDSCPALAGGRFEPVTCKNSFTQQQEIAEGNKVALQVYTQMPVLPENDPITRYVQQLGARLVTQAPILPGVDEQWPFNFHVVASSEVNAFALPGGSIFVNLGTIQAAESETQLAGVIAHEISHVVMRHSTCNLGRQRNRSLLYGLGAIGSAVLLGNGSAGQLAQSGISFGQKADFLHMSRDDEKQADLLGVNILNQSGYDPRGLPQFFEIIKAKYGAGGSQFLSDHPNPGNRTEYVNAEIATLTPPASPIVSSAGFRQMKSVATTRPALTAKEVEAGAWRRSGTYAARPGGSGVVQASGSPVPGSSGSAATQNGTAARPGTGSGPAGMPALSRAKLGIGDKLVLLQAARFALRYPASWKSQTDDTGTVTLAPVGGAGSAGVAYGVVAGVEKQAGNGVTDARTLNAATTALIAHLGGSGLEATASPATMTIAGQPASGVELRGTSPVAGRAGEPMAEHDWLVTVARPDGDLCYLVFVAPEESSADLRPTFQAIADSLRPQ